MTDIDVDVITVTAYKCTHCGDLFPDRDAVFEHLDRCPAWPATKSYIENVDFGNMILKERAV